MAIFRIGVYHFGNSSNHEVLGKDKDVPTFPESRRSANMSYFGDNFCKKYSIPLRSLWLKVYPRGFSVPTEFGNLWGLPKHWLQRMDMSWTQILST